jgi:hypothetical protein
LPRTQFRWIKLGQPIIESPQSREFGVESEATVIADLAIVLVEPESGSLEGVSSQIRLHVFLGYPFEFRILCLRGANCTGERECQQKYE